MIRKSNKSGSFRRSLGQFVGYLVLRYVALLASIAASNSLPLVVMILEPHWLCLVFQSPPAVYLSERVEESFKVVPFVMFWWAINGRNHYWSHLISNTNQSSL